PTPMQELLHPLEIKTHEYGGRKVLYSRSLYTEEDFWKIYPKTPYNALREETLSSGVWRSLTDKVLST
ncbi:MAG: hypothetical protein HY324_02635, partial [Chlamydiia bacterium]|nr:hypothetical protein [Chlamydiia bacterium]